MGKVIILKGEESRKFFGPLGTTLIFSGPPKGGPQVSAGTETEEQETVGTPREGSPADRIRQDQNAPHRGARRPEDE